MSHIPKDHLIAGYVASLKVIPPDGEAYWAIRFDGLNDMEQLGMVHDMMSTMQDDLKKGKYIPEDED